MADQVAKAKAQLEEVEVLLSEDPENDELKELRKDLREALSLAETLAGSSSVAGDGPSASGWVKASSSSRDAGRGKNNLAALNESATDFLPNQRCEIKPKDSKRWQGGVVLKRLPDFEYVVLRLHDSQEVHVKGTDEIREIEPQDSLRHDALLPGLKVRARYSGDGKYYQAIVEKRTEHGCTVRFEGYEDDEPEQVALEHVRLPEIGEAPSLLAPVEIPSHLIVQPDDSEDVKASKLRKQKALKRQAKQDNIEQVHTHKQDAWRAFQATAKRHKGTLTTLGHQSQFSFSKQNPDA